MARRQKRSHLLDALLQRAAEDAVADAASFQIVSLLFLKARCLSVDHLAGPILDPAEVVVAEDPQVLVHRAVDERYEPGVGRAVAAKGPVHRGPRCRVTEEEVARVAKRCLLPLVLAPRHLQMVGECPTKVLRLPELATELVHPQGVECGGAGPRKRRLASGLG